VERFVSCSSTRSAARKTTSRSRSSSEGNADRWRQSGPARKHHRTAPLRGGVHYYEVTAPPTMSTMMAPPPARPWSTFVTALPTVRYNSRCHRRLRAHRLRSPYRIWQAPDREKAEKGSTPDPSRVASKLTRRAAHPGFCVLPSRRLVYNATAPAARDDAERTTALQACCGAAGRIQEGALSAQL